ncbi:GD20926 [Drosophila simulans]|uniref:GD20926 n=1 Tax=Drosophila simulans TaxID=7240 RepID=B4QZX4_DROSI|nr:GD20926 [Drosophila simulans]
MPIPNPISNPSPPAPAPEPPVILAVMDMVEARAVFVPEILVDYADIPRLTIKM